MTKLNLTLILGGVGLVVFAVLGFGDSYSNPDRLMAAVGAAVIVWGVIRVRYKPR